MLFMYHYASFLNSRNVLSPLRNSSPGGPSMVSLRCLSSKYLESCSMQQIPDKHSISQYGANFAISLDVEKLKGFQLQGGDAP